MTRLDRQIGLSLVELMVAITIGLFLLAGAVTIFTNSKRTYTETDDSSRMQESLRFAMDMVTRDLRSAGYFGCAYGINPDNLNVSSLDTSKTLMNIRRGPVEAVDGPSDEIILRHAGGPRWRVTGDSSGSNVAVENTDSRVCVKADGTAAASCDATDALVFGGNGTKLQQPGIMVVSSCGAGDVFVASVATDAALTTAAPLAAAYNKGPSGEPDALVSAVTLVRYLVNFDADGNGTVDEDEVGLYRQDPKPDGTDTLPPVLVMPGIENMQITYAVDADDDGEIDDVVDAPTKEQWPMVVAAKVGMTVRSQTANATEQPPKQCLNGRMMKLSGGVLVADDPIDSVDGNCLNSSAEEPNDNRRRRSMETTVALRARLVASNFKDLPP